MKTQKAKLKALLRALGDPGAPQAPSKKKRINPAYSRKRIDPAYQYSDIDASWFPPGWNGDWDDVPGNR